MGKSSDSITTEQAEAELDSIMRFRFVDKLAFARAHFCMRALGCPVLPTGKPDVKRICEGTAGRLLWDLYKSEREGLCERHENWRESQDFGE